MFMNDCLSQQDVRERVASYLKDHQVTCSNKIRLGKIKGFNHVKKSSVYHTKIETDYMIPIPKIFYELCKFIVEFIEREGIFRKAGTKSRQDEIRKKIAKREPWINRNVEVIDVAVLLKQYLRELPVPLIPPVYHELFLTCCSLDEKEELIVIATLLLPIENLNLLIYLMKFFHEVASFSNYNKMNSYNLAVCITPCIIPIRVLSAGISVKTNEVTKILIEQADEIGLIPDHLKRQSLLSPDSKMRIRSFWNKFKQIFVC